MPTNNPVTAPWTGTMDKAVQRAALQTHLALPLLTTNEILDLNTGPLLRAVLCDSRVFTRDFADTTSPHDGVTVLRSLDGFVFKARPVWNGECVEAVTNTPPSITPSLYGLAYIVGTAPDAGPFAASANAIAIAGALGWQFVPPRVGLFLLNRATGAFLHYSNASGWQPGAGALAFAAGSVAAAALRWPMGVTIQDTRNTPPGSIANAYIVGSAATGAWAGHGGKVADGTSGAWAFLVPYEGAEVWDATAKVALRYLSGLWTAQTRTGVIQKKIVKVASMTTGGGTVATPPTTTTGVMIPSSQPGDPTFKAVSARIGSTLSFTSSHGYISIHLDGGVTSIGSSQSGVPILIPVTDASPHDYRVFAHANDVASIITLVSATMEEIA